MLEGSCLCGAVHWTFNGVVESATTCNCTACRRYAALWAYDYEGGLIRITGETRAYFRREGSVLSFNHCINCGCVTHWIAVKPDEENGLRRLAVNLRLSEPAAVSAIPLDIFDGLDTFEDLPRDGRCISHLWS